MHSEGPLTLILSLLRAGRGEPEGTRLVSLFGDSYTVLPKASLSLLKRERVRVRVHFDCMDTAEASVLKPRSASSQSNRHRFNRPIKHRAPKTRGQRESTASHRCRTDCHRAGYKVRLLKPPEKR